MDLTFQYLSATIRTMGTPGIRSIKAFSNWNEEMIQHLTRVIASLAETVRLWEAFEKGDIGYFLCSDDQDMHLFVQSIGKTCSRVREKLASLQELRQTLMDSNRYKVGVPTFNNPTPLYMSL